MAETRKLAAILAADVVGYSRLTGADEDRTLARLRAPRSDLIDPTIAVHNGRVVKRTGDGALVEFRSVVDAVRCAVEIQNAMVERNAGLPPERRAKRPFHQSSRMAPVGRNEPLALPGKRLRTPAELTAPIGR
jgi:adenylate cyclase